MSYHPTECIFDLLAASGPQQREEMIIECRNQCPAFAGLSFLQREELTSNTVQALEAAGIVTVDWDPIDGYVDLTDFGHQLVQEWNGWAHTRDQQHLNHMRQNYIL